MIALELHPIAEVFPMLDESSFEQLCDDIAGPDGLRHKLVTWRGLLIDGRNRMRALLKLGKDPSQYCRALPDNADPVSFALSANLHRRHLTESQRAMIGQRVKELRSGDALARKTLGVNTSDLSADLRYGPNGGKASEEAAEVVNVSPRLIDNAQRVVTKGVPSLGAAVIDGSVSLDAASEIARLPADEQMEVVAEGPEFIKAVAAERRSSRKKATAAVQESSNPSPVGRIADSATDLIGEVQSLEYIDPQDLLAVLRNFIPRVVDKTIVLQMVWDNADEFEKFRCLELWEEWLRKKAGSHA